MRPLFLVLPIALIACKQEIQVADTVNVAPSVQITAPADGSTFSELEAIEFSGTVSDANGLNDVQNITWASDLDGEFEADADSDGVVVSPISLNPGQHVITFRAIDRDGQADSESISVIVQQSSQMPVAVIESPDNLDTFVLGSDALLQGTVSDPNEDPDQLTVRWEIEQQNTVDPPTILFDGNPNGSGGTTAAWDDIDSLGQWIVRLIVVDEDDNQDVDEVLIIVGDSLDTDNDGDGFSPNQGDCDDTNAHIAPGVDEICGNSLDDDCNSVVDDKDNDADAHIDIDCHGTYFGPFPADDCNDNSAAVYPGGPETVDGLDNNCNHLIDEGTNAWDNDGDCFCTATACTGSINATCPTLNGGDCDDDDVNNAPGLVETCDGQDNDCNGVIDDGLSGNEYWPDADGDGYGNQTALPQVTCDGAPANFVSNNGDCNDGNPLINPVAIEETCNGVDDDCDLVGTPDSPDVDGDGASVCLDCDDNNALRYPLNDEACDEIDNDCDGQVDEGVTFVTYWEDVDADGYGGIFALEEESCDGPPAGFVDDHTDCDDTNAHANPGEVEVLCDGFDNDCNPLTVEAPDEDLDGSSVCDDCDDHDSLNFPDNDEFCDGHDNDCNGHIDDGVAYVDFYVDNDEDGRGDMNGVATNACLPPTGQVNNHDDCDDADPNNFLGNDERCDDADNDCDGVADNDLLFQDWYIDLDGDSYGSTAGGPESTCDGPPASNYVDRDGDCVDLDGLINPAAPEVQCDDHDNDCDPQTEDDADEDLDGFGQCDDCDDGDAQNFPGNPEVCDGADNNCDEVHDDGLDFVDYWFDFDSDGYGNVSSPIVTTCDGAPEGMTDNNTDCNDSNADQNPGALEIQCDLLDNDCDPNTLNDPDLDHDGVGTCNDCDDHDEHNFPGNPEVCDQRDNNCDLLPDNGLLFGTYWPDVDGDGAGDQLQASITTCSGPPSHTIDNSDDCDDHDPDNYFGNHEVCDGHDNDCDGNADNGLVFTDYWPDSDNDGFGSDAVDPTTTCTGSAPAPSGWATVAGDCNDASGSVKPNANEIVADSIDQDCDGFDDCYQDIDNDGHGTSTVVHGETLNCSNNQESPLDDDCDDFDPDNFPHNVELCDHMDNDCSGQAEQPGEVEFLHYWPDDDGDGFGDSGSAASNACQAPAGMVANNTDCLDNNDQVNPGESEETCNGLDDDCEGTTEDEPDEDHDGDPVCTDCDDDDPLNSSIADEICDGLDNNCVDGPDDGLSFVHYWVDADGDGYGNGGVASVSSCNGAPGTRVPNDSDCDDSDSALNQDDHDSDTYTTCDGDCDDIRADTYPGAADEPDENYRDEDCDGIDGRMIDAVFVSTAGSNSSVDCDFISPCRTINYAMAVAEAASLPHVYVRTGVYTGGIEVESGWNPQIFGGYDTGWIRDQNTIASHNVTIRGGFEFFVSEYITVWVDDAAVGLFDLEIDGPTAFNTENRSGRSSYAIYAADSQVHMERCVVDQGNGASGLTASNGSNASSSAPGSATGGNGSNGSYYPFCSGTRKVGGAGGSNSACASNDGGDGGDGGQSDGSGGCSSPSAGLDGDDGEHANSGLRADGGPGGAVCQNGCTSDNGDHGDNGEVRNGTAGSARTNRGVLTSAFWYGRQGSAGADGTAGGGGGGGGGGAGEDSGILDNDSGGSGGGGGAGGCAADGGSGGGAGGSSWGVFAYRSDATIIDSVINRANGGTGRSGGTGGNGQPGAGGGTGGSGSDQAGNGGNGGNGGHGGHGAGGGGGSGGNSYAFFEYQGDVTSTSTTVSGGSVGSGGNGGESASNWTDGNDGPNSEDGAQGTTFTCASSFGC